MSAIAWSVAHGSAAGTPRHEALLRSTCGMVISLPIARWWSDPMIADERVLDLAVAPVLDLGCGPGRHTAALTRRGLHTIGIDSSLPAVVAARARGIAVLHRSVFDRLSDEGRWGTALLLDGNIGIGGDPVRLLRRTRTLLRDGGRVLVEAEGPGVPTECLSVGAEVRPRARANGSLGRG